MMAIRLFLHSIMLLCAPAYGWAGQPTPWQMGFQEAASPMMQRLTGFHNDVLMWVITVIVIIVMLLLAYTCLRFRRARNPVPSKTTHHVGLEIIWTAIPILIVLWIAIPSIKLLFYVEEIPQSVPGTEDVTLKVVGHQWYWSYEYPEYDISFDSYMIPDIDLKPGQVRLLSVDNDVVLPINSKVRVLLTSADVIHSWAIPALGVKRDVVPGHMNETWVEITKPGMYYGQCSELCGVGHGFMPIAIRAVSSEAFKAWVASQKAPVPATSPVKVKEAAIKGQENADMQVTVTTMPMTQLKGE